MLKIYTQNEQVKEVKPAGSVVAIGNFDGVHLGHQGVLATAGEKAKELGLPLGVVTFYPHPRAVLFADNPPLQLTSFEEKAEKLLENGVKFVYIIEFTKDYAKTTPESFIQQTLQKALNVKAVVVGEDFRFGCKGSGDVALLTEYTKAFTTHPVSHIKCDQGERISSTRVRDALSKEDLALANKLLGKK